MTVVSIPSDGKPSFRIRIWYIVLTFCGCGVIIFVFVGVLLRVVGFIIF